MTITVKILGGVSLPTLTTLLLMTLRIGRLIILDVAMLPKFLDQLRDPVRSVQLSQFIATIRMATRSKSRLPSEWPGQLT
jgi:hypothetical protein